MNEGKEVRYNPEIEKKIRAFCDLFNQDEHPVKISFIKDLNYNPSCLFIFSENHFVGTLVNNLNRVTELAIEVKEGLRRSLAAYNVEILTQEEFKTLKITPFKGYIFYSEIPHLLVNDEYYIEEINLKARNLFNLEIGSNKKSFEHLFNSVSEYRNIIRQFDEKISVLSKRIIVNGKDNPLYAQLNAKRIDHADQIKYLIALNDVTTHAQNERIAREKENLFRGLVDQSISGIYILVGDKLKYTNERFCEIFGYSKEELTDMNYKQLVYPEDLEDVSSRVLRNLNNEKLLKVYEFRGRKKDGTIVHLSTNVSYGTYEGKHAIIGSMLDRSGEVESKTELTASEIKFAAITEKAPVAILIYQGENVVYANSAASEITGYSREEILKMKYYDLVYENDKKLVKNRGLERQRGKKVQSRYKFRIQRKNGEVRWVDFAGALIEYNKKPAGIIIASDITKSIETKEELKYLNNLLREIHSIHNIDLDIDKLPEFYSSIASLLMKTDLFHAVYFGFFDDNNKLIRIITEDENISEKYNRLIKDGIYPECIAQRLLSDELIVFDKKHVCENCPLDELEEEGVVIVDKIEYMHDGIGTFTLIFKKLGKLQTEVINLISDLTKQIESKYSQEVLRRDLQKRNEELIQSEIKLGSFFRNSNEGIYRIDFDEEINIDMPAEKQANAILKFGRIVECNNTFAEYYGAENQYDLIDKPFSVLYPEDVSVPKGILEFIKSGYQVRNHISSETDLKGNKKYFNNNNFAVIENGRLISIWGTQSNITSSYLLNEAIQDLSLDTGTKYGLDFLKHISQRIIDILDVDVVLIGEYNKGSTSVKTKVFFDKSGEQKNIVYDLDKTPCNKVLQEGLCVYEKNIQQLFPEDEYLKEMNAEGYIGVPLTNQRNENIGILVALYKKPVIQKELTKNIISLIAGRVSVELERLDYEKRLKRAFTDMTLILDSTLKAFVIINEDYTIRSFNEHAKRLFLIHFGKELKKGANFGEYVIKESEHEFRKNFLSALQRKIVSQRKKVKDTTGKEIWFSIDYEAAIDKTNKVFAIIYSFENITTQVQKESQFEEINTRNNILMSNTKDGIHLFDMNGKIIDANDAFADMLDYDKETLIGSNIKLYSPDSFPEDPEALFEGSEYENIFNAEYHKRDGTLLTFEITQTPIIVNEEKFIFRSARDVTEKISYMNKIKQLSVAVEQSPASILVTDIKGNIEYVNEKLCETSGYQYDEIIGKNPKIFNSGENDIRVYQDLWNTILYGDTWTGELQNKRKDGTLYWELVSISPVFDTMGKITNFIGVKEDITERKRMTEELARNKERLDQMLDERTQELARTKDNFKTIADRATEVIIQLDAYKNVLYANSVCNSFFDFQYNKITNWRFDELPLLDENREKISAALEKANETKNVQKIELYTKKGFYIDVSIVPELSASNKVVGYILFGHEYTEKEKQHQQVTMNLEYERELNKARAQFYSMVSHDFRSPLTAIKASAELIELCNIQSDNPEFPKAIQRIHYSVAELIGMLDELMLIHKMSSGAQKLNLKRISVEKVLSDVIDNVTHHNLYDHKINVIKKSEIPLINVDDALIKRVFDNLLSNAVKYSPKGTEILIELKADEQNLSISFKDEGRGVSKEELPKLFDMYFRSNSVKKIQGSGLGLAAVKKIVEMHDGSVQVESELNVGSKFIVSLPINLSIEDEKNTDN